eukprot:4681471-Amphidinium_carterae.1
MLLRTTLGETAWAAAEAADEEDCVFILGQRHHDWMIALVCLCRLVAESKQWSGGDLRRWVQLCESQNAVWNPRSGFVT